LWRCELISNELYIYHERIVFCRLVDRAADDPMKFNRPIVGRTLLVILPSAALLAMGRASLACWWFYAALAAIVIYDTFQHRHLQCMAVVLAVTPMLLLLRDRLLYSGPEILYVAAMAQAPMEDLKRLRANRLTMSLIIAAVVYWLASFAYSGNYASNYRGLELVLSACLLYLLAQHRSYLRPALLGFAISSIAVGFGLIPNGPVMTNGVPVFRLGGARLEGHNLGNPISFGLTVTMVFLLTISSSGRWLGLTRRRTALLAVQMITAVWLVLSTSRGSWAVAIVGAMIIYWAEPLQRRLLFGGAVLLLAMAAFFTVFTHDATLTSYLDKTFSGEDSLDKITTGRARQWASFPAAWADAPLFGHGPGTSLEEGKTYFDKKLIYHSLFLQIGVETGSFGLILLFTFLYVLLRKAYGYYRVTGDPIALIGWAGYVMAGISIPALDAASGGFLGLALIGTDLSRFVLVRHAVVVPAAVHADAALPAK
jgi:O-antigen ligase